MQLPIDAYEHPHAPEDLQHMVKYAIGHARQASHSVACRFIAVDSDETEEAMNMYTGLKFAAPPDQKRDGHTVRMLYDLGPRA